MQKARAGGLLHGVSVDSRSLSLDTLGDQLFVEGAHFLSPVLIRLVVLSRRTCISPHLVLRSESGLQSF